jgi:3-oxoacid CoA-transferase
MDDEYSGSVAKAPQDTLLGALVKRKEVTKLTAVSNNAGAGDSGLGLFYLHQSMIYEAYYTSIGKLFNSKQIDKIIASYPGG